MSTVKELSVEINLKIIRGLWLNVLMALLSSNIQAQGSKEGNCSHENTVESSKYCSISLKCFSTQWKDHGTDMQNGVSGLFSYLKNIDVAAGTLNAVTSFIVIHNHRIASGFRFTISVALTSNLALLATRPVKSNHGGWSQRIG